MSAIPDAELWAELETALAEAARIFPPPAPIQAHHVLQQIVRIGGLAALPRHSSLVAALQEAFELRDRHPDLFTSQSTLAFAGRLREAPPDTINAFLISLDDALTTEAALAAGGDGCTWQGEKEPCLQDIALCGGMSKECIKELKYSVCFCGISSSRIMLWPDFAVSGHATRADLAVTA